jgi:outer membrane protein TolC
LTTPRGAAAAALALVLSACAVDGDADVRAWRDVVPAGTAEVPPEGVALDVATSMRLANARNEALGIEGEAYVRALVDRRRAAAAFLPELSFNPAAFLAEAEGDTRRSGFDFPADGSWRSSPAVDEAEIRRAAASASERRALLQTVQDALLLDTARAHFAVVRLEKRAEVLRASLAVQQERVDDARARIEAGVAQPLDLSLSESRAATTRVDLIQAESGARNARTALAFLTGADVTKRPLDGRLDVPEPPPLETLVATAEAKRADLAAAAFAESAAVANAEAAAGQWWPSISADLTVFLKRHSEPVDVDWRSFLEVHVPVFERGLIEADVREALSRLREARLRRERLERLILRDLELVRESLETNTSRTAALRVRAEAAGRALDQAEGLWKAGLSTNLERLVAQNELLNADLELADSLLERRVLQLDLLRVTGAIHEAAGLERPAAPPEGEDAEAR